MRRLKSSLLIWLAALLLSAGCNHLAYVYNGTGGLELSAAPTEGNVKLVAGGDRETYAVVPRKNDQLDSEAMAVVAVSRVRLAGLNDLKFGHAIATGKCAVLLAQNPKPLRDIVDKLFKETSSTQKKEEGKASDSGPSVTPLPSAGGNNR